MKISSLSLSASLAAFTLLAASPAFAATQLITGGDFEGSIISTGGPTINSTGTNTPILWNFADRTPLIDTGTNKYAGTSNNGNQSGFYEIINLSTFGPLGTINQDLTLSFDVLNNTAGARTFGYEIQIFGSNADGSLTTGGPTNVFGGRTGYSFANSAPVQVIKGTFSVAANTASFTSSGDISVPYGDVSLWTDPNFPKNFTFKSGGVASANIAGYADITGIVLGISWDSTGSVGANVGIDNVSLTAAAIPEPSTFAALAGLGALGFAALRRRRS